MNAYIHFQSKGHNSWDVFHYHSFPCFLLLSQSALSVLDLANSREPCEEDRYMRSQKNSAVGGHLPCQVVARFPCCWPDSMGLF